MWMEEYSTRMFMHQITSFEEVSSVRTQQPGDVGGVVFIGRLNSFNLSVLRIDL